MAHHGGSSCAIAAESGSADTFVRCLRYGAESTEVVNEPLVGTVGQSLVLGSEVESWKLLRPPLSLSSGASVRLLGHFET